jgi:hypothetical protein
MHALLIEWSNTILDSPVLVQLGYGGATTSIPAAAAGNAGDNVATLHDREEEHKKVGDDQPLTQSQNHLEKNLQQQAVQKMPPTNDRAHAKNDDYFSQEQSLMTQSQNHLETRQQAVQTDGRVNAKNDFADDDEDPNDISKQEGNGDSAQGLSARLPTAAEKDREKLRDLSGKAVGQKQHGYVPSAKLLLESTDVLFNEITDPDTVTITDIHMSLCERYGFKLGKFGKKLVEKRLTELMNAFHTSATAKDSNAATEHTTDPYTTTPNRAASAVARKYSISSDDSDIEYVQYPPRRPFKTTEHAAISAKASNALSAKRTDGEALDVETTDDEDPPLPSAVPSAEAAAGRRQCS